MQSYTNWPTTWQQPRNTPIQKWKFYLWVSDTANWLGKDELFSEWYWRNQSSECEKMKLETYHTLHIKKSNPPGWRRMYEAKLWCGVEIGSFQYVSTWTKFKTMQNYIIYCLIIQTWLSINKNKGKIKRKFRTAFPLRANEKGHRGPERSCS